MLNAEKELEEKIAEVGNGLLNPPSDVDELLPLLDKTETLLSRVEQSPSDSMSRALHPAMKGLIGKELLGHSDEDVKVAVASCVSEITRITAPDAPYDDDCMREIFQMIVKAFEKLDDMSSRSYSKRVAILETVAKVRVCVVMLDLECDALILEMFHHFLATIRDNHRENVFSSMEVIMTLVLEESEDISSELISSLLTSVKKDKMDTLPIARRLAEQVISNCALKLKPCLMEVVQSLGAPLSDYCKIVATVCHENSDALEQNGLNASGECLADDSKFSERTVSDELAQGSGKMESEVSCPEVGTASGRSPKSVMSNGILQTGNDGSLAEPTSPNKKTECSSHTALPKNASAARRDVDEPVSLDVKDTSSNHINKRTKGHKSNSEVQLVRTDDHSQIVDTKGDIELPNRKKGWSKEADSQSECLPSKETVASTLEEHKRDDESLTPSVMDRTSVISPSLNEKVPESSRPRRGRPPGPKGSSKKETVGAEGDAPTSPTVSGKTKVIENSDTEAVASSKKHINSASDSNAKPSRRKKKSTGNVVDAGKPSSDRGKMKIDARSDEEGMLLRRHKKPHADVDEGNTSRRRQAFKTKLQKKGTSSYSNEKISSPKMATKADEDQNVPEESLQSKSGKKHTQEQASIAPGNGCRYDESLVNVKIKVWWPEDEQFYPGVVESYDPVSKMHKVSYFDGDVEVLLMSKERFEIIEGDEGEEAKNTSTLEGASAMSHERTKRSDSSGKKARVSVSSKSVKSAARVGVNGTEFEAKHGDNAAKPASAGKGGKYGSRKEVRTQNKSRERGDGRPSVEASEGGITSDNESNKSPDRTPDVTSKSSGISRRGRKPRDDTPIAGSRSKGDASRAGSKAKDYVARSGSKSTGDSGKFGIKSKEDATTRMLKKRKRASASDSGIKSDGNGSSVKKPGSPRDQDAQADVTTDVNSAAGKLPQNEKRSRKKRSKLQG